MIFSGNAHSDWPSGWSRMRFMIAVGSMLNQSSASKSGPAWLLIYLIKKIFNVISGEKTDATISMTRDLRPENGFFGITLKGNRYINRQRKEQFSTFCLFFVNWSSFVNSYGVINKKNIKKFFPPLTLKTMIIKTKEKRNPKNEFKPWGVRDFGRILKTRQTLV